MSYFSSLTKRSTDCQSQLHLYQFIACCTFQLLCKATIRQ